MDLNPSELEAAMHDALVKVAGPLLDEQTDMRAQLRAHRLLLALAFADRFADDRPCFDKLMATLLHLTEEAGQTLPGGPCTPEAQAAQRRVQMLLMQFASLVGRNITANGTPVA